MKRRIWVVAAVAVAALIVAGGLYASNMGFKINYPLGHDSDTTGPITGLNVFALPYFRQLSIDNASGLRGDIGSAQVTNIQRYNRSTGTVTTYPSTNFSLVAGEGYFINMAATVNYIAVGSHDPGLSITLGHDSDGTGPQTNLNVFAPPYHTTATNASSLRAEIGTAQVTNIQRYNRLTGTVTTYPSTNFTIVPGEAYFVNMASSVTYVPSHY